MYEVRKMTEIEVLKSLGEIRHFDKEQLLFMENDAGDDMYIALGGSFAVYITSFTGFPVKVANIGLGLCFGEMSVIDGWPRSATIISEEKSAALVIGKENFEKFIGASPKLAQGMMRTLSERAQNTLETVRTLGKVAADLPANLKDPVAVNPETDRNTMVQLSQRIRELNEIMGVGGTAKVEIKKQDAGASDMVLRREGHPIIGDEDGFDSTKMLGGKKYVCPYCHTLFTAKIPLISKLLHDETTFDQRVHYKNFNMLLYINVVCTNCNYCDTFQEFTRIALYDAAASPRVIGNQFKNAENFTGAANELSRTYDEAILSHLLQFECLKAVENSQLRQAKALHRLYWLYGECGKTELAMTFAEEAIVLYQEHIKLKGDGMSAMDMITLNVMLGKLLMDAKREDEAYDVFVENTRIGAGMKSDLVLQSQRMAREIKDYQ